MSQARLQILLLGPEASGKSTMTRHLLREGGDRWVVLEKPQEETGKSPPTPARVLDRPSTEQQQGAAPSHLLQHFKTPKYEVVVVDSLEPGGLPSNRFPGSAWAGATVLLVPAARGPREAGCAVPRQQLLLACNLPAKQLVVCVNKMDATQPPYSCQHYQEITQAVSASLHQLDKNPAAVAFLPISGLHGDNLLEPSSRMPWFRGWTGTGKRGSTVATSLQQVLDSVIPGWPQQGSEYTRGVWAEAETKSLLSVWKGIAGQVAHGAPLPREMSLELLGAGVRRSPQQYHRKTNAMVKQYFNHQVGEGRGRCPFYPELHAILGGEVTKLMYDVGHPCRSPHCACSAASTDRDSTSSLTEEEPDSEDAEDQETFLAGLEGDPLRMSSTPVPCLEAPPTLPASPDGTTSAGLKRKDLRWPILRLPKKPRGEALHTGTQPLAPPQGSHSPGSELDTALNWGRPILAPQGPLPSIPPTQPSPLSQPARPQRALSLHCLRAPPPWGPPEPGPRPQASPLQPWDTPPLQPPFLPLPSSPTHWPQVPPLHQQCALLLPVRPCPHWQAPPPPLPPQAEQCQPALPRHPEYPRLLPVLSQPVQDPPLGSPLRDLSPPQPCQPALSPLPPQHPQPRLASPPPLLDSRPVLQALSWSLTTTALA